MGPKTQELLHILQLIISILESDKETHWLAWMKQVKFRIEASDYSGVEKLLLAYGGMGSFNDFYLRKITKENSNFSELQSKAWELATAIKHSYESST